MRNLVIAVTVLFSAFTAWVIGQTGLLGFYRQLLDGPAGWQVLVDLGIALVLVFSWIARDARRTGRRFLPYLLLTLGLGSIGPLLYLVLAPRSSRDA